MNKTVENLSDFVIQLNFDLTKKAHINNEKDFLLIDPSVFVQGTSQCLVFIREIPFGVEFPVSVSFWIVQEMVQGENR